MATLDALLGLLTGPDQDGRVGEIITVSVRNAHSAAANLLAFGTYAVALPHSEILFHDVRYGGMEDVTPAAARMAAARLQNANEEFSLRLAHKVFRRLVWNYIGLRTRFAEIQENFPSVHAKYSEIIKFCQSTSHGSARVDVASFATALFAEVSRSSEVLISSTMERLRRWGLMTQAARVFPKYRAKGSRKPGLLDGTKTLFDQLIKLRNPQISSDLWGKAESHIHLFSIMLIENITKSKSIKNFDFFKVLESVNDDFKLIESINAPSHRNPIARIMLRHDHIFFDEEELKIVRGENEEEKKRVFDEARPNVQIFWYFCVLLCRELFNGEHILSPEDAQLLGIVDEVAGGGPIQSRREYRKQKAASQSPSAG